jgi:NitT/TauT family transport system substrate-binding protein
MKRSYLLGLAGGTLLLPACPAVAQAPIPIRVIGGIGEATAEATYALEGGFFAQAGLAAQITNLTNGGAMTAAVVSGAADVGVTNVGSMAAAHSRGVPVYLIAPSAVATDRLTTAILVGKDSPIRTARDFAGKTIAVSTLHDTQQAAVMAWIDENGGDSKAANFLEIPISDQPAALKTKRVDAAVMVEPFVTESRADTRALAQPYQSVAKVLMTHGWVANKTWFDANALAVRRFVGAMHATAAWANRNPQRTLPMLETLSRLPREILRNSNRFAYGETLDVAQIQPVIDVTVRYGFLARGFPAAELFAPGLSA